MLLHTVNVTVSVVCWCSICSERTLVVEPFAKPNGSRQRLRAVCVFRDMVQVEEIRRLVNLPGGGDAAVRRAALPGRGSAIAHTAVADLRSTAELVVANRTIFA